ncbi:hypothetical protein DRQ25_18065 [Candidatus Fermentibacteria bacterium]|nr:MAG: hypothetical protein DRQ25_18065 [Candidatus Fermentibacteria bacterium]
MDPHKASATDIAKLAGAAKILYDLEGELTQGGDTNTRAIKDITADMGRILGSSRGKGSTGALNETQSTHKQAITPTKSVYHG